MGSICLGLALAEAGVVESRCSFLIKEGSDGRRDISQDGKERLVPVCGSLYAAWRTRWVEYLRELLRDSHEEMYMKAG